MHPHAAPFHGLSEGDGVARTVDEAVLGDLVEALRSFQELEQAPLSVLNHGREAIESLQEGLPGIQHADVVEGRVEVGFDHAHALQAALEIFQIRPRVAVVGTEAGEVDVAQVEEASFSPVDEQTAVAPGVARGVEHPDLDAAQIKDSTVLEALRVGPVHVVELLDGDLPETFVDRPRESVDRHEGVQRKDSRQVLAVEMARGLGVEVDASEVVFVAVAQENSVGVGSGRPTGHDPQRRVDDNGFPFAAHQERIAMGVLPAVAAKEHRDRAYRALDPRSGILRRHTMTILALTRRKGIVARNFWLVKSEPFKYSWDNLVADGSTYWDGVRNYMARNNLQAMKKGDLALYYHSNEGKEVVGVARVIREFYPDPTTDDDRWVVVDFEPVKPLKEPVGLAQIREDPSLRDIAMLRYNRLSVVPITQPEFRRILKLGKTSVR